MTAAQEMRMMPQSRKYPLGLITCAGVWLTLTVLVPMETGLVLWEMVLVPGVVVGSWVDPVLVVLVPGTDVVDDVLIMDVPRAEVFGALSGTVFLAAGDEESVPGAVETEMGVVGLVPVILVSRKQVTRYDALVVEIINREAGVLRAEGLI